MATRRFDRNWPPPPSEWARLCTVVEAHNSLGSANLNWLRISQDAGGKTVFELADRFKYPQTVTGDWTFEGDTVFDGGSVTFESTQLFVSNSTATFTDVDRITYYDLHIQIGGTTIEYNFTTHIHQDVFYNFFSSTIVLNYQTTLIVQQGGTILVQDGGGLILPPPPQDFSLVGNEIFRDPIYLVQHPDTGLTQTVEQSQLFSRLPTVAEVEEQEEEEVDVDMLYFPLAIALVPNETLLAGQIQFDSDEFIVTDAGKLGLAGSDGWQAVATLGFAAFSAASMTTTISLGVSLPAKGWIHGVVLKHTAAFGGGGVMSAAATVLLGGTAVATLDVFQAPGDTIFNVGREEVMGAALPRGNVVDFGSETAFTVELVVTGANLDQLTSGSLQVRINWSTLP